MARWHVVDTRTSRRSRATGGRAYQLPLNVLAIGDPAAPVADVSRWNGTSTGPLIARVGPGTGGDATFTQIDPNLQRPTTDELVLALQARPRPGLRASSSRASPSASSRCSGSSTPASPRPDYASFQVPDPSFVPGSPVGAAQVTVLNRPAGVYGRDRYLLTNQTGDPAKSWALEADRAAQTEHLTLLVGAGLTEANGPAAAVGFLPTENDQDVLGNCFVDPNAPTNARGQLFQDRSHVGKIAAVYRFPARTPSARSCATRTASRSRAWSSRRISRRARRRCARTRTAARRSRTSARSTSACRRRSRSAAPTSPRSSTCTTCQSRQRSRRARRQRTGVSDADRAAAAAHGRGRRARGVLGAAASRM